MEIKGADPCFMASSIKYASFVQRTCLHSRISVEDPINLKSAPLALIGKHRLECPQSNALGLKSIDHFFPQMLTVGKRHKR